MLFCFIFIEFSCFVSNFKTLMFCQYFETLLFDIAIKKCILSLLVRMYPAVYFMVYKLNISVKINFKYLICYYVCVLIFFFTESQLA